MVSKVFITGSTGYIGGQVLHDLLHNKDHQFEVTALVRNETKAKRLLERTNNGIKTVIGSLDDASVIEEQVKKNDIVVNTADVDHVPSAEAIERALVGKKEQTILVHTSGTSIIGDDLRKGKKPSTKVYYDDKSIDEINTLDHDQPHRPVDEIILRINEKNPNAKVVVICPSAIFGVSDGYDKIISAQVPLLINLSVANKQAFSVYDGNYIWSHVHVKDLGELYVLLIDKLLKGEPVPQGKKGYYFGSYVVDNEGPITEKPSPIEHLWSDVSAAVGKVLYENKLVSTPDVAQLEPEKIAQLASFDFAPYLWGTNSRSRANNGIKIGWKPKFTDPKYFWDGVRNDFEQMKKEGAFSK